MVVIPNFWLLIHIWLNFEYQLYLSKFSPISLPMVYIKYISNPTLPHGIQVTDKVKHERVYVLIYSSIMSRLMTFQWKIVLQKEATCICKSDLPSKTLCQISVSFKQTSNCHGKNRDIDMLCRKWK